MSGRVLFVVLDEEGSLRYKGGYMRRIARSQFGCSCPALRKANIKTDEQNAIFAHELRNAMRLTVGFSKVYCELQ